MGGVFVSHASEDAATARAAVTWLEAHGHECWIAPRNIEPGDDYAQAIVRAIESADAVIFFLSRASEGSQHCRSELEMAKNGALPIVPVLLDDTVPTGGLRFYLSTHQWLETRGHSPATWHKRLGAALQAASDPSSMNERLSATPSAKARRSRRPLIAAGLGLLAVIGLAGVVTTTRDEPQGRVAGDVVWHTERELASASPVAAGTSVFVCGADGKLYALAEASGEEQWHAELTAPAAATPLVTPDVIYVGSTDGVVLALDRKTHAERWRFTAGAAVATTPALSGSEVVFGSDDGAVYALDAATGKVVWRSYTPFAVQSGPAVADDVVYAGNNGGVLTAFTAAAPGSQLWTKPITTPLPSSPTVADGKVYIGGADGTLYVYDTSGELLWSFPDDGASLTRLPDRVLTVTIARGVVLVPGRNGVLYALNTETHRPQWAAPFVSDKGISSRVPVADGIAYVAGESGDVYGIDVVTGAERWRTTIGESSRTAPAVTKSLLVVATTQGDLYAIQR